MTNIKEILEDCRLMKADHTPDGWPAIRMETVTALCDEVERLKILNEAYVQTLSSVTVIYQQMLEVLEELDECAAYWSEYDVPLGLHERIEAAIAEGRKRG